MRELTLAEISLTWPLSASPGTVWPYLTSATGLSCWQADEVTGSLEDGAFSLRWPALGARLDVSVADVRREEHIRLKAGQNVLDLRLKADSIELTHQGLDEADDLEGLRSSWKVALCLLDHAVRHHPGQRRKVDWLFRQIPLGPELAHYYFTDQNGLASWLGTSSASLEVGRRYALALDHLALRGEVLLAEPARDVALAVDNLSASFLAMRTLPAPEDGRVVALGLSSFAPVDTRAVLSDLEHGLDRLASVLSAQGRS